VIETPDDLTAVREQYRAAAANRINSARPIGSAAALLRLSCFHISSRNGPSSSATHPRHQIDIKLDRRIAARRRNVTKLLPSSARTPIMPRFRFAPH
jgi:hypothetical protein